MIIYFSGRAACLLDKQPKKVISVAVKALKDEPSKEQKDEFFREVTLMSILTHPNIVQLLAVSTEEEPYGMVFEFMSGGDLNQYLRNALPAETSLDSNEKAKGITTQNVSFHFSSNPKKLFHVEFSCLLMGLGKPHPTPTGPGEVKGIIENCRKNETSF